ncbi:MAG: ABC transporter substrate-binding protein [Actinomycetota bacterium]
MKRPTSRSFRAAAFVVALAALAAACGDDDPASEPTASAAVSEGSPPETSSDVPDDGPPRTVAEPGEPAAEVTVVDAVGEVSLTPTDTGIYVLDENAAVGLLTLGIEPIAIARFYQDVAVAPVLELTDSNTVEPGSIEAIAATNPELILGVGHPSHIEARPQLEGVTTVVTPDGASYWGDQLRVFGAVTGTDERAEAVVSAVETRVQELRSALVEAGLDGGEVSIIQTFGTDYYTYGPATLAGELMAALGFTRSELQSDPDGVRFIQVAPELLAEETDADLVFAPAGSDSDGVSVFDNPTVEVGDTPSGVVLEVWFQAHALAAWVILDDVEAVLLGDGQTTTLEDVPAVWNDLIAAVEAQ